MDKIKKNCTWWSERTKLEKGLVLLVILTGSFVLLLAVQLNAATPTIEESKNNTCTTPACIHFAANMLDKMDLTIDPCKDIYQFACGNFLKTVNVPDERTRISSFSVLEEKVVGQLRNIFEEPQDEDDPKPLQLLKTSYRACMNTSKIELEGISHIKKLFKHLGGFPILEGSNWNEKNFDWKKLLYNMRRIGLRQNFFLTLEISPDLKNSSLLTLTITQPCLSFEWFRGGFNETNVKATYDYLVDSVVLLGADRARAVMEMREMIEFKIKLAKITVSRELRRDSNQEHNPMTIRELQKQFPSIPWLQYINVFLSPIETMTSEDTVNVALPKFLTQLENLLLNTPKRVLANYMFSHSISTKYLPEVMRKRALEYQKIVYGNSAAKPRWQQCVETESLSLAMSYFYVKRYFDQSSKRKIAELILDVKNTFYDTLKSLEWMDKKTKQRALEKADKMSHYIGYPNELLDSENLEEYYDSLELDPNAIFLDVDLNISLFDHMHYVKRLREPIVKNNWIDNSYAYIVNAFYDWHENIIELPSAILQDIYFGVNRPNYMNYGALGEIIGHEITHGFDDYGRQYDKDGNVKNWWQPETNRTFIEKARCFIEQYGNYSVPEAGMNLNGRRTLGENIADNGGIKIAYKSYLKRLEREPNEPMLPGFPYTPQQMFWITTATTWCAKYTKPALKNILVSGVHSPNNYRVLVPFMNSGYFARDFNCSLGSPMNPRNKCGVW